MSAGPRAALAPQARDFAPDLLTLQESPPSSLPRWAMLAAVGLVAALVAWAALARLDIVAVAQGRLVPASFTKVVQPAEPGVVTEILVKDGDAVKQGQVLLRLDPRASRADVGAVEQDIELRQLTLVRIDAELADKALDLPAQAAPALAAQVSAQHVARRASLRDSLAQDEAALTRARADLAAAQQTLIKLREVVPIVKSASDKHEQLAKEGFISQLGAADRRKEYVEKNQELQAQGEAVKSLQAAVDQQERKLDAVRSSYRTQLQAERLESLAQLTRLKQEQEKSNVRAGQLEIRAPADGIVKDLVVTASGAVVQAGAQLLNIVPRGEPLMAEVLLGNDDAGFVARDQAVRLKIATYPFQKYGLLEGTVTHIAADTTQPQGNQQPPSFRALIRLAQQELSGPTGQKLSLSPGMLVSAEIHQGDRTVLEYLLSPVQRVGSEAGRER